MPAFEIHLSSGKMITLEPGRKFTAADLPGLQPAGADGCVAEVARHPQNPAILGLKNLSRTAWMASQTGGDSKRIEPQRSAVLTPTMKIMFGTASGTIYERSSNLPATGKLPLFKIGLGATAAVVLLLGLFIVGSLVLGSSGPKAAWAGKPPVELVTGDSLTMTMLGVSPKSKSFRYEYQVNRDESWQPALEGKIEVSELAPGKLEVRGRVTDDQGHKSAVIQHVCLVSSVDTAKNVDALLSAGERLLQQRRWNEVYQVCDRALPLAGEPQVAPIQMLKSRAHIGDRNFIAAITTLDAVVAKDPGNAQALSCRGWARMGLYDETAAQADWQAAISASKPAEAREFFERGRARFGLAQLGVTDETEKAWADFDAAIKLNPQHPEFLNWRGRLQVFRREYDLAIADFSAALRLDPKNSGTFADRGEACAAKFDFQRAVSDFREGINCGMPKSAEDYYHRGRCHVGIATHGFERSPQFEPAFADFSDALRIDAKFAEAFCLRGKVQVKLQKKTLAREDFDAAIRLYPRFAEAYAGRADSRDTRNEAIEDFTKAIEIKPTGFSYYRGRGINYRDVDNEKSAANYRDAVRLITGKHPWDCTQRAYLLNELGYVGTKRPEEFDRAIAECNAAIERDKTVSSAFEERGWAYMQKEMLDEAIRDFTTAIRLEPNNASNYIYRIQANRKRNQLQLVADDYGELIRLNPQNLDHYEQRAKVFDQLGKPNDARVERDRAKEIAGAKDEI